MKLSLDDRWSKDRATTLFGCRGWSVEEVEFAILGTKRGQDDYWRSFARVAGR